MRQTDAYNNETTTRVGETQAPELGVARPLPLVRRATDTDASSSEATARNFAQPACAPRGAGCTGLAAGTLTRSAANKRARRGGQDEARRRRDRTGISGARPCPACLPVIGQPALGRLLGRPPVCGRVGRRRTPSRPVPSNVLPPPPGGTKLLRKHAVYARRAPRYLPVADAQHTVQCSRHLVAACRPHSSAAQCGARVCLGAAAWSNHPSRRIAPTSSERRRRTAEMSL